MNMIMIHAIWRLWEEQFHAQGRRAILQQHIISVRLLHALGWWQEGIAHRREAILVTLRRSPILNLPANAQYERKAHWWRVDDHPHHPRGKSWSVTDLRGGRGDAANSGNTRKKLFRVLNNIDDDELWWWQKTLEFPTCCRWVSMATQNERTTVNCKSNATTDGNCLTASSSGRPYQRPQAFLPLLLD